MPYGTLKRWFAAIGLCCLACLPVGAVQCSASTTGVVFGLYDPFGAAPSDSASDIAIACDSAVGYRLSLSTGTGDATSSLDRHMAGASDTGLHYNLYSDASHVTVWGDGSAGGATVSGTTAGNGLAARQTVYARIPPRQNVRAGNYHDAVIITVSY